jgi:signal transduction histidine kinase
VWGREEERRRLRQDLHDELSPSLAGIRLAVAAARTRGLPDESEVLLARAQDEAADAVDVIRRILDDLRPPALDELGLVGAVRRRADSLRRAGEFEVTVSDSGIPATLPPAVEVGLFRIASEAMANAVRHSGARHCTVEMARVNGSLRVVVGDDGQGLAPDHGEGVGLRSMRERAEALGGSLETVNRPVGLAVTATVPLVMIDSDPDASGPA